MKLETAKGVRDFPPEQKIIRQKIVDSLREIFEIYGFNPLETPIIERYEILASKYAGGEEILKETFQLTDQGGRKLGLRYDLTVPFCRFVGMNPQLKMPFKRYQISRVFRDGPIKLGRYREFWQCDVDVVGCESMLADAEILAIASDVFKKLGMEVIIKVNNRKVLDGIMEFADVPKEKRISAILSIDKIKKISRGDVEKEMGEKGISETSVTKIFNILGLKGDNGEILENLKTFLNNKTAEEGIAELKELLTYAKSFGIDINIDISLARGLNYYTRTIFEVYLKKSEITSSVAAGGRFDNLVGQFLQTEKKYPAVGISFGLDVLTDAMNLAKKADKKSVVDVYVIPIKTTKESVKLVKDLRKSRIKTDLDIIGRSISKNLAYANFFNIPYVVFVGEKELAQKKVKLRDMDSGKEKLLGVEELIKTLKKVL